MTQVEKTDAKLIGTVCIGICATGSSTETKITGECKIINKKPQWVNDTETGSKWLLRPIMHHKYQISNS